MRLQETQQNATIRRRPGKKSGIRIQAMPTVGADSTHTNETG